jgi:hypothetical protein
MRNKDLTYFRKFDLIFQAALEFLQHNQLKKFVLISSNTCVGFEKFGCCSEATKNG